MANKTYHQEEEIHNVELMRDVLQELPKYVARYFRSIEYSRAPLTRLGYARDIKSFFEFLCDTNPSLKGKSTMDVNAYVTKSIDSSMTLTFDITKLIAIMQEVSKIAKSSSVTTIVNALASFDGICAGFELKK